MDDPLEPQQQNRPPHEQGESSENGGVALPLGILTTIAGVITWFTVGVVEDGVMMTPGGCAGRMVTEVATCSVKPLASVAIAVTG